MAVDDSPPSGPPGAATDGWVGFRTHDEPSARDLAVIAEQLGRPPRGVDAVVFRNHDGEPAVVQTSPRLPDGTPFPTLFYLTSPRLVAAVGGVESSGVMAAWTEELAADADLAAAHRRAHEDYLARRERVAHVPRIAGVSAGGMPDRVKCLHVLVAHALAVGPGVNPFGDRTLALLAPKTEEDR